MTVHRKMLVTFPLLFVLAFAAQAQASPRNLENSLGKDLRAALLTSVAIEADGVSLSGKPGVDIVKVDGPDVEEFLRSLGLRSPEVVRTRVFLSGRLISEKEPATIAIGRQEAIYRSTTGSLFVVGGLGSHATIEDVRILRLSGKAFFLHDIYLDGEVADLSVGRSLPVLLESTSATVSAVPQVSSIGGVTSSAAGISNGRVSMDCGTTWNGKLVINDQRGMYPWTVNGSNFGSVRGTIAVGGQDAPVTSWTSTKIVADPTSSPNWGPATTTLKVTASTGTTTYGVSFAPSIRSRIYGQCTWFVAFTRLSMGYQPSPTAYSNYKNITAQWVPHRGDQLAWQGRHTAIITAVTGPVSEAGGLKSYKLTVGQYNADCHNSPNTYQTDFQFRTSDSTVTKFPKSSVSSLGSSATYYPYNY